MISSVKKQEKLLPILLSWTVMTAIAAAIFGGFLEFLDPFNRSNSDEILLLMVGALVGGLIVGGLEWRTLRLYRISMSPLWCGLKPGVMILLLGFVYGTQQDVFNFLNSGGHWWLMVWGFAMDVPRWWLLRSHFRNAQWWLFLCALGWVLDAFIILFAGVYTIEFAKFSTVAFVAVNGAINGAWIGFFRGLALTMMVRDRQKRENNFSSASTPTALDFPT
ncbi:MAG: hypothetical protein AAF889_08360 [Cyanobacteria bacterium P01_D01_bin.73]